MTLTQARELKPGALVRFDTGKKYKEQACDPASDGVVMKNEKDLLRIKWADNVESEYPTKQLFRRIDLTEWFHNLHLK